MPVLPPAYSPLRPPPSAAVAAAAAAGAPHTPTADGSGAKRDRATFVAALPRELADLPAELLAVLLPGGAGEGDGAGDGGEADARDGPTPPVPLPSTFLTPTTEAPAKRRRVPDTATAAPLNATHLSAIATLFASDARVQSECLTRLHAVRRQAQRDANLVAHAVERLAAAAAATGAAAPAVPARGAAAMPPSHAAYADAAAHFAAAAGAGGTAGGRLRGLLPATPGGSNGVGVGGSGAAALVAGDPRQYKAWVEVTLAAPPAAEGGAPDGSRTPLLPRESGAPVLLARASPGAPASPAPLLLQHHRATSISPPPPPAVTRLTIPRLAAITPAYVLAPEALPVRAPASPPLRPAADVSAAVSVWGVVTAFHSPPAESVTATAAATTRTPDPALPPLGTHLLLSLTRAAATRLRLPEPATALAGHTLRVYDGWHYVPPVVPEPRPHVLAATVVSPPRPTTTSPAPPASPAMLLACSLVEWAPAAAAAAAAAAPPRAFA